MINLRNKKTGEIEQHYECTTKAAIELCFANIECLLHIALADSDEHIRQLGGEQELLNLMNGYLDLAQRLSSYDKPCEEDDTLKSCETCAYMLYSEKEEPCRTCRHNRIDGLGSENWKEK